VSRILVVDASVAIDLLARYRPEPIEKVLWEPGTHLAAPELLDIEAVHALRRLDRDGCIPASRIENLVVELRALPIRRYRHASLIEAVHALRRLDRDGCIPASRIENLVVELRALPIRRYRHASLVAGVWSLRGHLTAYDAAYVALTRLLNATLITRDERLARASGLGHAVMLA